MVGVGNSDFLAVEEPGPKPGGPGDFAEIIQLIIPKELLPLLMGRPADPGPQIKEVFAALEKVESSHPRVAELRNYGEGLESVLEELKKPSGISNHEAERRLSLLSPEEIRSGVERIVKRLATETSYLQELSDSGVAQALAGGIENGSYGARVKFLDPEGARFQKLDQAGIRGQYSPWFDKVEIAAEPPSPKEIWAELAEKGILPRTVAYLDHELTHDMQTSKAQRAALWGIPIVHFGVLETLLHTGGVLSALPWIASGPWAMRAATRAVANDSVLTEAHAYEAAAASPSFFDDNLDEKAEIMFQILGTQRLPPSAVPKVAEAYDLVHTLRLLGLNDREIGSLVTWSKWDEEKATFPKLHDRVEVEREALGISDENQFTIFCNALHARFELERMAERRRAQAIAIEELGNHAP